MTDLLFQIKGRLVCGNVELFSNRKLKQRYCVISKTSNFSTHLKLYIFKSQAHCTAAEECGLNEPYAKVYGSSNSAVRNGKSATNCIVLTCDTGIVILAMKSIQDLLSWSETIKKNVSDIDYRVRLVRTEGCRLQSGAEGRLHVQKSQLCFYTEPVENCRQLSVWSLSSVRKYWLDADNNYFVFESSKAKCDKGTGLHQFESEQAEQIYNCMHAACLNKPLMSVTPPSQPSVLRGDQQLPLHQQQQQQQQLRHKSYGLPQSSAVTYSTLYSASTSLSMSHPITGADGRSQNMYHLHQRHLLMQQQQQPPESIRFRRGYQQELEDTDQTVFTFEPSSPSVAAALPAATVAADSDVDQTDDAVAAAAASAPNPNRDYCNLRDTTSYLSMSDVNPATAAPSAAAAAAAAAAAYPARHADSYVQMSATSPIEAAVIVGRRRSERSSDFDSPGLSSPSSPENQYDEVAVDSAPSSPKLASSGSLPADQSPSPPTPQQQQQQQRHQRIKQRPPPLHLNRSQSEDPSAVDEAAAAAELRSPTMRTKPMPQSAGVGADGFSTLAQRKPRHGKEYVSRDRLISSSSDTAASPTGSQQQQPPLQQSQPAYNPLRDYVNLRPNRGLEEPTPQMQYAQLQHHHHQQQPRPTDYHQQPQQLYAAQPQYAPTVALASQRQQLTQQQQQAQQQQLDQLNYTELDHNKTRAFQEIALEEESRRNPASRSASSASVNHNNNLANANNANSNSASLMSGVGAGASASGIGLLGAGNNGNSGGASLKQRVLTKNR